MIADYKTLLWVGSVISSCVTKEQLDCCNSLIEMADDKYKQLLINLQSGILSVIEEMKVN